MCSTGRFAVGGELKSLLDKNDITPNGFTFVGLFRSVSGYSTPLIVDASNLVLTPYKSYSCYRTMFYGCRNLSIAPAIPYIDTEYSNNYYYFLFNGCRGLKDVRFLGNQWLPSNATNSWMTNTQSTGTFHVLEGTTWTDDLERGANTIPAGWTIVKDL